MLLGLKLMDPAMQVRRLQRLNLVSACHGAFAAATCYLQVRAVWEAARYKDGSSSLTCNGLCD